MTMQIRMTDPQTGKEYHFSPSRDIAYMWPKLIELAYEGLRLKNWEPWYGDYLKASNVTEEDVFHTLVAYSKFCVLSIKPDIKTPFAALTEAGFFDYPKAAQLVVMTKIGQLASGAFWAGIRSATPEEEGSADLESLMQKATLLEKELTSVG